MIFVIIAVVTSPVWITLLLREVTSSKHDEQWYRAAKKFNDWWDR